MSDTTTPCPECDGRGGWSLNGWDLATSSICQACNGTGEKLTPLFQAMGVTDVDTTLLT